MARGRQPARMASERSASGHKARGVTAEKPGVAGEAEPRPNTTLRASGGFMWALALVTKAKI